MVQYLASTDSSIITGVLPQKGVEGATKASKDYKKTKPVEKSQLVEEELVKEIIPTKIGVLKLTKKPAKNSSASLIKTTTHEPVFERVKSPVIESSNPRSSTKGTMKIRKLHVTKRGLLIQEVLFPSLPASKKHQVIDMAQKLHKKKRKDQVPLANLRGETEDDSDNERSDIQIEDSYIGSPRRDSRVDSNLKDTRDPDVSVNVSNTDTNINLSDQENINIPEKKLIKPSGVSHIESER